MRKNIIKPTAEKCIHLLDIAKRHIHKQGDGCYNRMGAAYKADRKRDVIAALCGGIAIKSNTFGVISDEKQKYIVTHIVNRHQIRADRSETRGFVVKFLQDLQDAHDAAFDPFNVVSGDRMELFDELTNNIFKNLSEIVSE